LVAEDSTIHAGDVLRSVDDEPFTERPFVIAYTPTPHGLTATLVGSHRVGRGRIVLCQFRLVHMAIAGDAAATAVLGDLLREATAAPALLRREEGRLEDGRRWLAYRRERGVPGGPTGHARADR